MDHNRIRIIIFGLGQFLTCTTANKGKDELKNIIYFFHAYQLFYSYYLIIRAKTSV